MLRRRSIRLLALVAIGPALLTASLAAALSPSASAAADCTRFAGTTGDDSAAGTREAPFRTATKLMSSLSPGEVGCLLPGSYAENLTVRTGGESGRPIRLRSAPEGRATLSGRLWIAESADDVVFSDLLLDGRNDSQLPSPTVNGDRIAFYDNEVTNYHAASICFVLGHDVWGVARDTVLERNRIHDCGALPATNFHHGVYVSNARNTRIVGNLIYDNADRGIQLYPDAQGTVIANNVLDGNGSGIIFSGAGGVSSSGSRVYSNIITNSVVRFNVESWYPSGTPAGVDNLVDRNCIWNGFQGNVAPYAGYTVTRTIASDPLYVNRPSKDFSLPSNSPCAGLGPTPTGTPTSPAPVPAPPPSSSPSRSAPQPSSKAAAPASAAGRAPEAKRPEQRKSGSARRQKPARPLFTRKGGQIRILWGGTYRTQSDLRRFVSSRGVPYAKWSKKHARAAYVLRTGRLPAGKR